MPRAKQPRRLVALIDSVSMQGLTRILVALSLLGVTGCAVLGPKLRAPDLSILEVQIVKGDLFEQRLKVRMRVQNPNTVGLAVRGITYTIELDGQELGRGLSGSSFFVPPSGEAEFDMNITANLAGTLLKLVDRARKSGGAPPNELAYRLRGEVRLDKGLLRTVPFDQKGAIKLR